MPKRAARLCSTIGCTELVTGKDRYCRLHLAAQRKRVDSRRPPSSQRGYDKEWQQIRAEYLEVHPFCSLCPRQATQVHHRLPLAQGGTHNWENLQALCDSCHSRVTASEGGGFGNRVREGR